LEIKKDERKSKKEKMRMSVMMVGDDTVYMPNKGSMMSMVDGQYR
jgi:hypothetical protein